MRVVSCISSWFFAPPTRRAGEVPEELMLLDRLALFDLGNNNLIGEPFERAYIACCLKALEASLY